MTQQDLSPFQRRLGHAFREEAVLCEALRHSSYVNEQRDLDLTDNERLEFLGDAVLDLVITHILMDRFPETREGDLSRMRAIIVNESQLAQIAQDLDLGQYLLLGRGEAQSHGEEKTSILADGLEAVIAAVYLDGGLEAAFEVIRTHFSSLLPEVQEKLAIEDYKSRLQELVQVHFKTMPVYRVISATGPDHDKTFEVRLNIGDSVTTCGTGKSKKAAEQEAARVALERLRAESREP